MGVPPQEQGPIDALTRPVLADRLCHRRNVGLVERPTQTRTSMTRGTKRHPLPRIFDVGRHGVIRGDEVSHVDEVGGLGCGSGACVARRLESSQRDHRW